MLGGGCRCSSDRRRRTVRLTPGRTVILTAYPSWRSRSAYGSIRVMKTDASMKEGSLRSHCPAQVFRALGRVVRELNAYVIKTSEGATFRIAPNDEQSIADGVHIDEISVPTRLRRRGIATKAMTRLCKLADTHGFILEGGPIGLSDTPWREEFVAWVRGFGFKRDPNPNLRIPNNPKAYCVRRVPQGSSHLTR